MDELIRKIMILKIFMVIVRHVQGGDGEWTCILQGGGVAQETDVVLSKQSEVRIYSGSRMTENEVWLEVFRLGALTWETSVFLPRSDVCACSVEHSFYGVIMRKNPGKVQTLTQWIWDETRGSVCLTRPR